MLKLLPIVLILVIQNSFASNWVEIGQAGHSYYYEAEKMAEFGEDLDQLTKELNIVCHELNLKIFNKNDFFSYIELLNKEANLIFETDKSSSYYFKENYNL